MYDALKRAIKERIQNQLLTYKGDFVINRLDATDLIKLRESDLVERGYDPGRAKDIAEALMMLDYRPLMDALGVNLILGDDEPSLLGN